MKLRLHDNHTEIDQKPVDIVIAWVDGGDPEWLRNKKKFTKADTALDDSINRYRDWDNLKYIFRGIESYMPWVRTVHLVTYGHLPKWLNTENPMLNIVKHSEYIPSQYLPTFSLHPIELNLHRIPDLADQFIYFNDDTYIVNPVKKTDYFKNGLPCGQMQLTLTTSNDSNDIFPHIVFNVVSTVNKNFNKIELLKKYPFSYLNIRYGLVQNLRNALFLPYKHYPGYLWPHLPSPFLKSTFNEVWLKEAVLLDQTSSHKFRDILDVNQYLFTAWQFSTGKFHPKYYPKQWGAYFSISTQLHEATQAIRTQKYSVICINDSGDVGDFENAKHLINSSFDEILPNKSRFEI